MSAVGVAPIVVVVVVAALLLVVGGVVFGVLSARRARSGPAVPDPYTRQDSVAGFPVQVRTPPFVPRRWIGLAAGGWSRAGGSVEVRLSGPVGRPALTVLPRHRPEADVSAPHAVDALLAVSNRSGREVPTGDAAFDDRYRVTSAPDAEPAAVIRTLSAPLRALLLGHDVVFLILRADGAWVSVFYAEQAAFTATRQAALQSLQLLVSGWES